MRIIDESLNEIDLNATLVSGDLNKFLNILNILKNLEIDLTRATLVSGSLTALAQRHDVYSYCLNRQHNKIEAAARNLIENLGADFLDRRSVSVKMSLVPLDEGGGFRAYATGVVPLESLTLDSSSLLRWPKDENLIKGKEPFVFRFHRLPPPSDAVLDGKVEPDVAKGTAKEEEVPDDKADSDSDDDMPDL